MCVLMCMVPGTGNTAEGYHLAGGAWLSRRGATSWLEPADPCAHLCVGTYICQGRVSSRNSSSGLSAVSVGRRGDHGHSRQSGDKGWKGPV